MKKLFNKLNSRLLKARCAVESFVAEERGDTNFISIAIILVVVIAVAVVFIAFGDKITGYLKKAIEDLFGELDK